MDSRQPLLGSAQTGVFASGAVALYTLALLTVVNAFSNIDRYVFSMLLPLVKHDLQLSDAVLGLLSGAAFALSYSMLSLPFAFIADRWSRTRLIAIGFACWSTVTALTGATVSAGQLAGARFLLGAAEATSLSPSASLLADRFDLRRRALALGVMGTSPAIGMLVSFPIVGLLADRLGWRAAFVAVGIPGVLAALLFGLTVREPPRAASGPGGRAGVGATLRFLLGSRTYLLLLAGGALTAFELGAFVAWTPTFLMRVHHLSATRVGALVGVARGPAGIIGSLGIGFLASRLSRRDVRWVPRILGISMMLLCPVDLLLLFSQDSSVWALSLVLDAFLAAAVMGPCFTIASGVARPQMRSVAAALFLVFAGVTGQSLGPYFIGRLNDLLTPQLGALAVRFSLAAAAGMALLGGIAYWSTGAFLRADAERAARPE
ncbi:MAG TPA: MFS transporter [Steroidobacteraceae bacterium]|nr:MFS transporter [Steroidobacteraceae bacterium]